MKLEDINTSKNVRAAIIGIVILIIALGILRIGISIGERRGRFSGQFGQNYERNFMGPRRSMMGGFFDERGGPDGHGAIGNILSINLPQLIVTGPDNLEKTILVSTSTVVRQFQQNIDDSQLKVGDFVVIIGNPNDKGQIEAGFIRVMPQPVGP